MAKTELKPCPFCGGKPTVTNDRQMKWFYIECLNDGCPVLVQGAWHLDMDNAIEGWNRRAEDGK